MKSSVEDNALIYKVLMTSGKHYSILPEAHEVPVGCYDIGRKGTLVECVDYICAQVPTGNKRPSLYSDSNEKTFSNHTPSVIQAEQEVITGPVPFTPLQHRFFKEDHPAPHHWNVAQMLELHHPVNEELLEQAVYHILKQHDALRLRFVLRESIWQQFIVDMDDKVPFATIDFSTLSGGDQIRAIEASAIEQQTSLNLSEGPVMRVTLFNLGSQQRQRLLVIVHHLICDDFSLHVLLEDLFVVYQQLIAGSVVQLSPKTTSLKYWAERQIEYAQSVSLRQELDYWLTNLRKPSARLPVDKSREILTESIARTVKMSLTTEESRILLDDILHPNQTTITDVLLTALAFAFTRWTGEHSWIIEMVRHGRETIFDDIDLSQTVGWLVTHTPILLDLDAPHSAKESLHSIKRQIRCIPNDGFGYEVLRYLSQDVEVVRQLAMLPQSEVIFNFFGRSHSTLAEAPVSIARESIGPTGIHTNVPEFLLIFNGAIFDNQLHLILTYSDDVYYHSTIEQLAQYILEALREIIS